MKKYNNLFELTFILIYLIIGILYLNKFYYQLADNIWLEIDGITKIVIPDTFLYADIVDLDNLFFSLFLSGTKNTFIPSLIWFIFDFNWFLVFFFNLFLIYLIYFYFKKNCEFYCINSIKLKILLFLMPSFLFYSIGSLKELPLTLFFLMALYFLNKNRWKSLFLIIFLIFLVRYQIILIMALSCFVILPNKNRLKFGFMLISLLSIFYPILKDFGISENAATQLYRLEYGEVDSLGGVIESWRENTYFISFFAIIFRIFQSMFEPIIHFLRVLNFDDNGAFSIMHFQNFITNLIIAPFIFIFFIKFFKTIYQENFIKFNTSFTLFISFLFFYIVIVGGFTFIHFRYLFPVFPLIIIFSSINKINNVK
jgi:hypothetical protein